MYKVLSLVTDFSERCGAAKELLEQNGCAVLCSSEKLPYSKSGELLAILPETHAVITGLTRWDAARLSCAKRLKAIAMFGVGVDHIDLAAAKLHGVKVFNAPGINANAVAEFTVGIILSLLRSIPQKALHLMENGAWDCTLGMELAGKTVGLYGFGSIGRLVAKKLAGFDVHILVHTRRPDPALAAQYGIAYVSRERLFAQSDILSLHIPATDKTKHLIDACALAQMKPGAYLINTARGSLVDEVALMKALERGALAGAALDVFGVEPLPKDSPLYTCPNILCTPHTASETHRVYEQTGLHAAKGILEVLNGRVPPNWLNP